MDGIRKTFVINLDRRKDRWGAFQKENNCLLGEVSRFSAIDGKGLKYSKSLMKLFNNNNFGNMKGVIGCCLSHRMLWKKISEQKEGLYLIFEDDARCSPTIVEQWNTNIYPNLEDIKNTFHLLVIGGWGDSVQDLTTDWTSKPLNPFIGIPAYTGNDGKYRAEGYVLSVLGAQKLYKLSNTLGFQYALDSFLSHAYPRLNVYVTRPLLCYQPPPLDNTHSGTVSQSDIWTKNTEAFYPDAKYPSLDIDSVECEYEEKDGVQTCRLRLPVTKSDSELPTISLITPTYNRKKFWPLMWNNYQTMDYPKEKVEWIIVDDGDESLEEYIPAEENIRYIRLRQGKLPLGKKRNFAISLAKNEFIVHMDDDDFYPPASVLARVKILLGIPRKSCVGCTRVLCYDLLRDTTFEAYDKGKGGYPSTISESTMAYRKEFWKTQPFCNTDTKTECLAFIQNRHSEFIDVPSCFIITQLTHDSNTIERKIDKEGIYTVNFLQRIPVHTRNLILNLQRNLIQNTDEAKMIYKLIKKLKQKPKRLQKELEKLSPELQRHPLLKHFRCMHVKKTKSSGKDLIFYCPGESQAGFWTKTPSYKLGEIWTPKTAEVHGIGGSEEAVIHLSVFFAKRGWNVTVYNHCGKGFITKDKVKYKPYWHWNPWDKQDVVIIWRVPHILTSLEINSPIILLDLHDALTEGEFPKECIKKVHKIMVKSNYHRSLLHTIPDNKFEIIPNGIIASQFKKKIEKDPFLIINTSSSDRSLYILLKEFKKIKKEVPEAKLFWAYGWGPKEPSWKKESKKMITMPGCKDLGRLGHKKIISLYQKASIFAYPTVFDEIDCISLTKALAAGCYPITTDVGALGEKDFYNNQIKVPIVPTKTAYEIECYGLGLRDKKLIQIWTDTVIKTLKGNIDKLQQDNVQKTVCEQYDWNSIGGKWINCIEKLKKII